MSCAEIIFYSSRFSFLLVMTFNLSVCIKLGDIEMTIGDFQLTLCH